MVDISLERGHCGFLSLIDVVGGENLTKKLKIMVVLLKPWGF